MTDNDEDYFSISDEEVVDIVLLMKKINERGEEYCNDNDIDYDTFENFMNKHGDDIVSYVVYGKPILEYDIVHDPMFHSCYSFIQDCFND